MKTKQQIINELSDLGIITDEESKILMGPNLEPLKDFDFWKEWKYNESILDNLEYENTTQNI